MAYVRVYKILVSQAALLLLSLPVSSQFPLENLPVIRNTSHFVRSFFSLPSRWFFRISSRISRNLLESLSPSLAFHELDDSSRMHNHHYSPYKLFFSDRSLNSFWRACSFKIEASDFDGEDRGFCLNLSPFVSRSVAFSRVVLQIFSLFHSPFFSHSILKTLVRVYKCAVSGFEKQLSMSHSEY